MLLFLFIKNIFVLSEAHFTVYKATNKLILKRGSGQSEAKREKKLSKGRREERKRTEYQKRVGHRSEGQKNKGMERILLKNLFIIDQTL